MYLSIVNSRWELNELHSVSRMSWTLATSSRPFLSVNSLLKRSEITKVHKSKLSRKEGFEGLRFKIMPNGASRLLGESIYLFIVPWFAIYFVRRRNFPLFLWNYLRMYAISEPVHQTKITKWKDHSTPTVARSKTFEIITCFERNWNILFLSEYPFWGGRFSGSMIWYEPQT